MSDTETILKTYFGHDSFRPLQKEIVESVLEGNDTIALLPTGGGKSVCFQVPALIKPGLCIVVTPLIALMKDQVENLRSKNVQALALYSGMSRKEIDFELENCVNGKYKFLYVSPERLMSKHFLDSAQYMDLNFLAIDEAHCISQWGYDFRPPYLKIAEFRNKFANLKCIALTASATPKVIADIEKQLELKKCKIFSKSFVRSNLSYVVQEAENKHGKILDIAVKLKGSGLVYVKSRRKTIEFASYLNTHGVSSDYYHAGLDAAERSRKQEDWKSNKIRVMVCTNAFGMGIDKPDVRFVIHEQKPDTLEAYYQEAGRAGRDGKKSYCVLLHHKSDFTEDKKNIESRYPSPKEISRVYELICNYLKVAVGSGQGQSYNFDINELSVYYGLTPALIYNSLRILEADAYFTASESVYLPSRMKILCTYSELYDWQLRNEGVDQLFKVLLRSYGGLFDFYTNIYEREISKRLHIPERKLKEQLLKLKQVEIIDYIPQNNKPQLNFLENRFSSIHISDERIAFLRNSFREKMEYMNRYVLNNKSCRSSALVSYFGEENAGDCGICDVCLSKKDKMNDSEKFNLYYNKIRDLSSDKKFRSIDLASMLKSGETENYLSILRWLKDHGYMDEDREGYWVWTGKKR